MDLPSIACLAVKLVEFRKDELGELDFLAVVDLPGFKFLSETEAMIDGDVVLSGLLRLIALAVFGGPLKAGLGSKGLVLGTGFQIVSTRVTRITLKCSLKFEEPNSSDALRSLNSSKSLS